MENTVLYPYESHDPFEALSDNIVIRKEAGPHNGKG